MTLLHIGLSLSPTWLRAGSWRRPDSRVEDLFTSEVVPALAAAGRFRTAYSGTTLREHLAEGI